MSCHHRPKELSEEERRRRIGFMHKFRKDWLVYYQTLDSSDKVRFLQDPSAMLKSRRETGID